MSYILFYFCYSSSCSIDTNIMIPGMGSIFCIKNFQENSISTVGAIMKLLYKNWECILSSCICIFFVTKHYISYWLCSFMFSSFFSCDIDIITGIAILDWDPCFIIIEIFQYQEHAWWFLSGNVPSKTNKGS